MTVHHWGENPVGTWYLSILDVPQKSNSDKKGLLRKWTLELHGTAEDPQPHWIPPGTCPHSFMDKGRRIAQNVCDT